MNNFKSKNLGERLEIFSRIVKTYPDRLPILMYPSDKSTLEELKNEK